MVTIYSPMVEKQMQSYYESLSEKDRRRYAAVEAKKLGYGGINGKSDYPDRFESFYDHH